MGQHLTDPKAANVNIPAQTPSGGLWQSSAQAALIASVQTLVLLDSVLPNFADGIEDVVNHKITPGVAGYYSIAGQVTFTTLTDAMWYRAFVKTGGVGTIVADACQMASGGGFISPLAFKPSYWLEATDYLELWCRAVCGNDNTTIVVATTVYTFLSVQRVR